MKTLLSTFLLCFIYSVCGAQWIELNVPNTNTSQFTDIHAIAPDIVIVIGSYGTILKSTDGGSTWQQKISGISDDLDEIKFSTPTTGYVLSGKGKLLKTSDTGESWTTIDLGSTNTLNSLSCVNENLIFISGINEDSQTILLKSEDGGNSWQTIVTNNPQLRLYNIQFFNNNIGFAAKSNHYPTYDSELLKTEDGGKNWMTLENAKSPFSFINENIGFYYLEGLYKTIDTGNTFSNKTEALAGNLVNLYAVNENNIWGILGGLLNWDQTTRGIMKISSNDSEIYTENYILDKSSDIDMTKIYFANETTGYVIGMKNEKATIWKNNTGINILGVEDTDFSSIKIYPNPITDKINISLNQSTSIKHEINLMDMSGKLVFEKEYINQKEINIDAKKFPKGIYILRIKNEKQVFSRKIIIQ